MARQPRCAYCGFELRGLVGIRQVVGGIHYCKYHEKAARRDAERDSEDEETLAIIDPFSQDGVE